MSQARSWSPQAVIGALGIVYGDIGTSPLYTLENALVAAGGKVDGEAVLGVLSLIFWALAISVTLKYVSVVMRADNGGEGGILALLALAYQRLIPGSRWAQAVTWLALAGTAFFFCDALITPAISVLGAVEGLEVLNPTFNRAVVPVTIAVLAALFAFQRRGTAQVATLFGPIMIVWFGVIAALGLTAIGREPGVLAAINPLHGISLLTHRPQSALLVIGAVFLAITGGEALYADMGHFGKTPVRIAWFALVWPALLINYFGQGALLLSAGQVVPHTLYHLVPAHLLPWMVVLATAASVIACQASISGAFSLARQAVQLDLLPRIRVQQTSEHEQGQIYVPMVNWLVFAAVLGFVLRFRSSAALTDAYGAAVCGTMLVTTIVGSFVAATQWSWPRWVVGAIFGLLLVVDGAFAAGNMTKVPSGGWIPLTLGAILFFIFLSWRNGRIELRKALARFAIPLTELPRKIAGVHRVPGTAVFLASDPSYVPTALMRNLEHNHVVHERIIILNIEFVGSPRQDPVRRVTIEEPLAGLYVVNARYGFMETPDVNDALKSCRARGLRVFTEDSSFFVGRHIVRARNLPGVRGLQRRLFARMQRHSTAAQEFFKMPSRGVIVLNTAVEI